MKRLLTIWIILIVILCSCNNNKEGFNISGEILDSENAIIKLYKLQNGSIALFDSTRCHGHKFNFEGWIKVPDRYYIQVNDQAQYAPFFLENKEIEIVIDSNDPGKLTVYGSDSEGLFQRFLKEYESTYKAKIDSAQSLFEDIEDDYQRNKVREIRAQERRKAIDYIIDFSTENNASVVAPWVSYYYIKRLGEYNSKELKELCSQFDSTIAVSEVYMLFEDWVNQLVRIEIGQPAIDFTMNDTLGNELSLLSFNDSYLLLDFWAAECVPCRRDHPKLLEIYNKYNEYGFEIFSVFFGEDLDEWIKAIREDKITWTQVSSLSIREIVARDIYLIDYLPQNVLIDDKGIIVAKNLKPAALEKFLEKVYR